MKGKRVYSAADGQMCYIAEQTLLKLTITPVKQPSEKKKNGQHSVNGDVSPKIADRGSDHFKGDSHQCISK